MTIPKSYEALAADLASEKILSKTLLGQKEAYMKLADKGGLDLSESKAREAALREELETEKTGAEGIYQQLEFCQKQRDALQQRLAVAEQRAPVAVTITDEQILEAMRHSINSADGGYVVDTAPENVIAAGRALLESARLNGLKT